MISAAQRELLTITAHRTAPLPDSRWVGYQRWEDVCFLHWRCDVAEMRKAVPQPLEIDLVDGSAWVTITPLRIPHSRPRNLPVNLPCMEVNFRTYVRWRGVPGIYFLSLDCDSIPSVLGARSFYSLPYWASEIKTRRSSGLWQYASQRAKRDVRMVCAVESVPAGHISESARNLIERYCLFVVRRGEVRWAPIHHLPWSICDAMGNFSGVGWPYGIAQRPPEIASACGDLDVLIWPLLKP